MSKWRCSRTSPCEEERDRAFPRAAGFFFLAGFFADVREVRGGVRVAGMGGSHPFDVAALHPAQRKLTTLAPA